MNSCLAFFPLYQSFLWCVYALHGQPMTHMKLANAYTIPIAYEMTHMNSRIEGTRILVVIEEIYLEFQDIWSDVLSNKLYLSYTRNLPRIIEISSSCSNYTLCYRNNMVLLISDCFWHVIFFNVMDNNDHLACENDLQLTIKTITLFQTISICFIFLSNLLIF